MRTCKCPNADRKMESERFRRWETTIFHKKRRPDGNIAHWSALFFLFKFNFWLSREQDPQARVPLGWRYRTRMRHDHRLGCEYFQSCSVYSSRLRRARSRMPLAAHLERAGDHLRQRKHYSRRVVWRSYVQNGGLRVRWRLILYVREVQLTSCSADRRMEKLSARLAESGKKANRFRFGAWGVVVWL